MSLIHQKYSSAIQKNTTTLSLKNPSTRHLQLLSNPKLNNNTEAPEESKKQKFESFLTYRKRLSRLALVQGIYFHEQFMQFTTIDLTNEEKVNEAYRTVIYFYKRMLFNGKYGTNKKNKKLEEKLVRSTIHQYITNAEMVDGLITKFLTKRWKLKMLNSVVRAGLRGAICEALFSSKKQYKLITAEYTTLMATLCTEEKEVDFFNAILDNIIKDIQKRYAK